MYDSSQSKDSLAVRNAAGLEARFFANGALRTLQHGALCINLFVANAVESGSTALVLRRWRDGTVVQSIPLLGPAGITRWALGERSWHAWHVGNEGEGLQVSARLVLSPDQPVWAWQVTVQNHTTARETVDLLLVQDVGLTAYDAVRTNEFYVSQYLDHTPLQHPGCGTVLMTRQNLPGAQGKHASLLTAALGRSVAWATDAVQLCAPQQRGDGAAAWMASALPASRWQGEHAVHALQHAPCEVAAGASARLGFACGVQVHHPAALGDTDLSWADAVIAQGQAALHGVQASPFATQAVAPSLFDRAPVLPVVAAQETELQAWCGGDWRQQERDAGGQLLSFFHSSDRHVVTLHKERQVLRPHGHMLRSGGHLSPDENSLTSTVWMAGVFNSMVTEGHVSINRLLSTVRGNVGGTRAAGQRVFVEYGGQWQLLHQPSAFEMYRDGARWWYCAGGLVIEVGVQVQYGHALTLALRVLQGPPCRFLVTHQIAMQGDDGLAEGGLAWQRADDGTVRVHPRPGSAAARTYGEDAHLKLRVMQAELLEQVGDDSLLFADAKSRGAPMVCLQSRATAALNVQLSAQLLAADLRRDRSLPALAQLQRPRLHSRSRVIQDLADIVPWFEHNALVHYLAPRGLEQYAGGGWGTRDVSQGPVELLLSQGLVEPVRDLLLRVFAAQDESGDWPQWFMFFARDAHIRASDSHGDVVFWPLLALGQYLQASGDAALLLCELPFYTGTKASVWSHVQSALRVITARRIAGTALAAYGHGDWNDSLQPADPHLRDHMCSAWTVTLHLQMLTALADGLAVCGWDAADIDGLRAQAAAVEHDFQRHLLPDGVLTGYALFDDAAHPRYLLHPQDDQTGAHYSLLPMIHAIANDMLTPLQAQRHLVLIQEHLLGPDGARLFDKPLAYRGGPQTLFQRAESASNFGREIGLMYMHAHLRWAEALAHLGRAEDFLHALAQANPIGLQRVVPQAQLRQVNSYSSSSDGVFADRYEANARYDALLRGEVPLEVGWRVYSSGAGIALGLVWRCLLGLKFRHDGLDLDPVLPASLDGLEAEVRIAGHLVRCRYLVGAAGHGVSQVDLNGRALPFTRQPNRYRMGAARVAWVDWYAAVAAKPGPALLTVRLST